MKVSSGELKLSLSTRDVFLGSTKPFKIPSSQSFSIYEFINTETCCTLPSALHSKKVYVLFLLTIETKIQSVRDDP